MATTEERASERIAREVTSWPGVEGAPGSRGEFAFTVGGREIGHLHGDHAAHFGFPKDVGAELREQGRVGPHPVAPHKPAWAARRIESDADVRDVIELLRLNYSRVMGHEDQPALDEVMPGLYASKPQALPFAPALHARAFLLQRERGNVLVYSVDSLSSQAPAMESLGGVARHYLNHGHEASFASDGIDAPLFVHERDREAVGKAAHVRGTFSRRHTLDDDFEVIPTPGHTPGATAYLWDSGEHRFLFTGDTLFLGEGGEWVTAVLDSSDRAAYVESLELLRELDFDVLVPWIARGERYVAITDRADAQRRIDAARAQVGR